MSAHGRKLVAVVDDDPRILESLQGLLESAGYDVELHSSGTSVLANAVSHFDCLISDIGMPHMDGFELRARLKGLRPELPVFLVSGQSDPPHEGPVEGHGDGDFFRKPFDGPALLAAIAKALQGASG